MDAQSLLDDGPGTMPHLFDGRAEVQKPPLYYWLVALVARARRCGRCLGGAAAGGAGGARPACLLLYGFGARQGRPVAGLVAGRRPGDGAALHLAGARRPHRHAADTDDRGGAAGVLPGVGRERS